MATRFTFSNLTGVRLPSGMLKQWGRLLARVQRVTGKRVAEVSLAWVTPAAIRSLNRRYLSHDRVTDVLSFTYQARSPVAGELVMCPAQARQQAREHKHSLANELELLFVHGLLHLLGYDHERLKQRQRMRRLEQDSLGRSNTLIKRSHAAN